MTRCQRATILLPAPYGALTQLWAGTMPEALNFNGAVRPSHVLADIVAYGFAHAMRRRAVSGSLGQSWPV